MMSEDFPFEIREIKWKYAESGEIGVGRNPGKPVHAGVRQFAARCPSCGADWTALNGPSGIGAGYFEPVIGGVRLVCPNNDCEAEGTISNSDLEALAQDGM